MSGGPDNAHMFCHIQSVHKSNFAVELWGRGDYPLELKLAVVVVIITVSKYTHSRCTSDYHGKWVGWLYNH
jgi:hypothetical protein